MMKFFYAYILRNLALAITAAVTLLNTAAFAQKWKDISPNIMYPEDKNKNLPDVLIGIGTSSPKEQLDVIKNIRSRQNIIVDSSLTANLIISNELRTMGLAQIDALLVNGTSTFSGNLTLANSVSIIHAVSTGSFSFNNSAGDNLILLGYTLSDPAAQQGLVIAPAGFKGNTNGSIALGDANPDGQILLALGTGSSGTRINMDGAGKRMVFQNDGGDKYTMGGVNAPTLLETTQGINVAKRPGFTFSGTHLLNVQGSSNAQQYYQNDTLVDLVGLQTAVDSLKQNPGSQWQTSGNNIYFQDENLVDVGNVGIGISAPSERLSVNGNIATNGTVFANSGFYTTGSITTGNLTITDKISTKSAAVEQSVVSDTLHALKSLEVNNSLRLSRDTTVMYAEMSTKDTAVALMLQKEPSAPVVIGDAPAPPPGEQREKLTVAGNSSFNGNVKITGSLIASTIGNEGTTINAATINASNFNAVQLFSDTMFVTRIMPAPGDSEVHIGAGSISFNNYTNRISSSQSNFFINFPKGLTIGNKHPSNNFSLLYPAHAWAENSIAIGQFVGNSASANNAIVIGSGDLSWGNGQLINDKPNSLMIGFNSAKPTLFVSPSNGQNTTGNVGVGTDNPVHKLDVRGHIGLIDHLIFNSTSTHGVINWPESKSLWFRTNATPGDINSYTTRMIVMGDGKVGIGTESPQAKLQVNVNAPTDIAFAVYTAGAEQFRVMGDGKFYGRGYKITLDNFPDYVFGKNYERMSHDTKAKYFDEFGHMPYMPSAEEIKKDGLDVGDGLIGITRNVEENSLDINDLFKLNSELFKRIEKLELANKEKDEKIKLLDAELNAIKK